MAHASHFSSCQLQGPIVVLNFDGSSTLTETVQHGSMSIAVPEIAVTQSLEEEEEAPVEQVPVVCPTSERQDSEGNVAGPSGSGPSGH